MQQSTPFFVLRYSVAPFILVCVAYNKLIRTSFRIKVFPKV